MGEVYRARDAKLNRDVALKILPDAFAADPDRLARFRREAQVLASLNHPNIATIYGFEDSGGDRTRSCWSSSKARHSRIGIARGPIALDRRPAHRAADRRCARGRARTRHRPSRSEAREHQGPSRRHGEGAGLRSRKGARPGGRVERRRDELADASRSRATELGVILGTAAYMSPEQAKGKAVDKRADIWAFGCVLFEMLSGQRPFKGDDDLGHAGAVLRQDIDWRALPASTPPSVRRLLARCLDRDVKLRLRDIGEARIELARIQAGADEPVTAPGAESAASAFVPRWKRAFRGR